MNFLLDQNDKTTIDKLIVTGNVVQAIKYVREKTGMGLKEAKDYIDRLRDTGQHPDTNDGVVNSDGIASQLSIVTREAQQICVLEQTVKELERSPKTTRAIKLNFTEMLIDQAILISMLQSQILASQRRVKAQLFEIAEKIEVDDLSDFSSAMKE